MLKKRVVFFYKTQIICINFLCIKIIHRKKSLPVTELKFKHRFAIETYFLIFILLKVDLQSIVFKINNYF